VHDRIESLKKLCERYGIAILYAFGSRAKEVAAWTEGRISQLSDSVSDIDIGVKMTGSMFSIRQKVELASALEDLFGCRRVDLVVLDEADPFLAFEIIRGERLYAIDDVEADEYDLYVMRRAGDLLPLERERAGLVLGEKR